MEKPRKLITRQYVGLVSYLNSRMAQLTPLFQESQKLDESELVDSLVNKVPRRGVKFAASDQDSDPKRKKRLKSKDEHGKKRQKQHSKLY